MKNVVLLTIDTLRADVLGCYGSRLGLSPFIDSLAASGRRFDQVQAVGPYTQASFPGILTSSYYLDHADHGKGKRLSPERLLVSEALRKAGLATAAFHSNPYLCALFGWNRGWDVFYDSMQDQVTDEVPFIQAGAINAKVDGWLASRGSAAGRPFFLWVHYMDMHEPYVPAQKHVDAVDPSVRLSPQEMFGLFKGALLARDVSDPARVELLRKLYLANLRKVDDCVRELFAILDRRGVLRDSAVIITSDHGDEFGEHGGLSHDGKMYEELLRVPLLLLSGPGGAGVCSAPVSGLDIPPTVLDLFGLPAEPKFQGRSLLAGADPARVLFAEAIGKRGRQKETDRPVYACRDGALRVSHRVEGDRWELFDLAADPAERLNLMASSPRAGGMKARLATRLSRQ
ncbi:MAG TPA: sulfatase [Planctomycetota bacterium]|nr:sulfatase [Planctomycetota bacterium]